MRFDLSIVSVPPDSSIREVVTCIDRSAKGIALITDKDGRLLATVTDGDVRRALLDGRSLDTPVHDLLSSKITLPHSQPITAPQDTEPETLLRLMRDFGIRHVPLLDEDGNVVELVTLEELLPDQMPLIQAVIMAGGQGTRLRPLTEDIPKPMLTVGERPLMELIVEHLRESGVRRVCITTHYKPETIMEHFGNGDKFGIEMSYVNEDKPLGTAGALGLMPEANEPILVINGDILTQVNFRAMFAYHQEHRAEMTVAVSQYGLQVPYGVVECEGSKICQLREKPSLSFFVNAGIYLLEPSVYQYIPKGQPFNMTELIHCLLAAGRPLVSFPIREYWLDIGQHDDYAQARNDVAEGKLKGKLKVSKRAGLWKEY